MSDPIQVSISWSAERVGNDGYVLEQYSDGTERKFGPMRANIVPAFIQSRRKIWQMRMERRGHTKVSSDETSH